MGKISLSVASTPVVLVGNSVRATDASGGFYEFSLHTLAEQDAIDPSKLCYWPTTWQDLPRSKSGQWVSWTPPRMSGRRFLVANQWHASGANACSGTKALAEALGVSCPGLAGYTSCGAGSYLLVDVRLKTDFNPGPHPNYEPHGGNPYTAKFYAHVANGVGPEYRDGRPLSARVVWSGPWTGTSRRFVGYQKYFSLTSGDYPLKANNAYLFSELEMWSGASVFGFPGQCDDELGTSFKCEAGESSPIQGNNRVFDGNGSACAPNSGMAWPNHGRLALAKSYLTRPNACVADKYFVVSRVVDWWDAPSSSYRKSRCADYFANALARTICEVSANVGMVIQGYGGGASGGCEFTVYSWGNAGSRERDFRNGELRWSEYQGGLLAYAPTDPRWVTACTAAQSKQNWYYAGKYQVGAVSYWDSGNP